ncbi:putative SWI/SNF-related matrix-associated actin-dependent regulator of chromatin subfamily A member 3-like 1 [Trifolium pratense]|uniref:putative SWI/SNF-related matrix-associated actin-dependent regulator of chromatin subfamily A member 3-like 1 n=1 Tax=Trifolium pratense TaxID=57577 RepID=UPI001E694E2A|nr:putative SWI/SNF-related matrix-associated actin-dependent regulator of chromatin subfamily A member 3-like 1 [Trifolium pratense]
MALSPPQKRRKHNKDVKFTTHFAQLSLTTRAHYQTLFEESRICFTEKNYKELFLRLLPKLRKICIHFKLYNFQNDLVPLRFEQQDVSTNLKLESILTRRVLQEKVDCSICLSTPSHALITRCTHIFCRNCIRKWFACARNKGLCPYCRGLLTIDDMFSETRPDTKLEILMKLLRQDTSTNSKSVIFTRYDDALCYFHVHLHHAGFNCLIYTTKKMKYCENSIMKFENSDGPVVLLVDFETARRKQILINAECRVFLLDACRKSTEEELVARVTQPVSVSRLISENTIEDKILSLDEMFTETDTLDFYDDKVLRYLLDEDSTI